MENTITIRELISITLATEKLQESIDFYQGSWGLSPQSVSANQAYMRGTGSAHHLLELVDAEQTALQKVTFSLDSRAAVDAAATILANAGTALLTQPAPLATVYGGYGFTVQDPDGNTLELAAEVKQLEPKSEVGHIRQISHLVLNTPNLDAMSSFYQGLLGFKLSDWYENNNFVFLRCNSAHHRIVLAPAETVGINHIAFDVDDCDAMMRTLGRMKRSGYSPVWGPGRHGPGGNTFCYFADPNGYVIEVSSDLIEISDDNAWVPKEWKRCPENADIWGTSGGPSELAIKLMNGHRDNFKLDKNL